jgi:hypothetical protein
MSAPAIVNKAMQNIIIEVQNDGQIKDLEALAQAHPDGLEGYILDAFHAKLRGDSKAMNRALRDAQMEVALSAQMSLPGVDDVCLPRLVRVRDEDGQMRNIPADRAKWPEIKQEVTEMRRHLNAREKVVGGYEFSIAKIEQHLPVDDEMTGADIRILSRALMPGASDE